jgi:hypothetical protein
MEGGVEVCQKITGEKYDRDQYQSKKKVRKGE